MGLDVPLRLEKRLAALLHDLARHKRMSLSGMFEEMILQEGKVMNPHLADYRVPTALDVPEVTMGFVEEPDPTGPFGAKGIGELPMDGPAPAIINALRYAGWDLRSRNPTQHCSKNPVPLEIS